MNLYENLFILKPELDESRVKEIISDIEELINKNKGKVIAVENWGKKRLAYKVKKLRHGIYVLITFKIKPLMVSKIERGLQLKDDVIKYLTTVLDEKREAERQKLINKDVEDGEKKEPDKEKS